MDNTTKPKPSAGLQDGNQKERRWQPEGKKMATGGQQEGNRGGNKRNSKGGNRGGTWLTHDGFNPKLKAKSLAKSPNPNAKTKDSKKVQYGSGVQ